MKSLELTTTANPATIGRMWRTGKGRRRVLLAMPILVPVLGAMMVGGCVSVKAPDKPIVIELNINIRQEVVYRLAQDAANTVESNPEIF